MAILILVQTWGVPLASAQITTVGGDNSFQFKDGYTIVTHAVPANDSGPWSIAADGAGHIWFVEENSNQLGSFNPNTGVFTQYPIPTPYSTPVAVTADAKGNVWFTELSTNKLGELPQGESQIMERPIPGAEIPLGNTTETLGCGPGAILADPTGSIWVACLFSNQIDEYFPTNKTFASFDLTVFPSGPAGMLLDGKGDLWFTAADANMLGKATISQLRNGTSDGIDEFAPLNATYLYRFTLETSFLGGSTTAESSLPTPSGIALDSSGRLWVTEHVDSSFDSYDPATGSLDRYWTSQTGGAYGFGVTFPNGIAINQNGTVWIAEHYGNRVAEFNPVSGQLIEYPVSNSTYDGVYQLTLDRNGNPWFVEIQGNSIGELLPSSDQSPLTMTLPTTATEPGTGGMISVPIGISEPKTSTRTTELKFNVSGITTTGILENMTWHFAPDAVSIAPGASGETNLTLATRDLSPGTYYLTLTAGAEPQGVLYSVILKLTVTEGGSPWTLPAILVGGTGVAVISLLLLWRRRLNAPYVPRTEAHGLILQRF